MLQEICVPIYDKYRIKSNFFETCEYNFSQCFDTLVEMRKIEKDAKKKIAKQKSIEQKIAKQKIAEQKIAEIEKSDGETRCIVCMENKCNTMLLPCEHTNFCVDCAALIRNDKNKCPFCRELIESVVVI